MITLKQKKFLFLSVLLTTLFFSMSTPFFAGARGLVPCGGYKDAAGTQPEDPCTFLDMFTLVARVTDFLIASAGLYAVFKIVDGGFWLVVSMGSEETITKRKGEITDAVVGFVLVMIAYIIVNTAVNFLLLAASPTSTKIDLQKPCTYLLAGSDCLNGK